MTTATAIWAETPYSMCTDITRFNNQWFCTFREGVSHWGPGDEGVIRIIVSDNGHHWQSVTVLKQSGADLRDPKLSVTPDGRLMLTCFRRFNPNEGRPEINQAYFSDNGHRWSNAHAIDVGYDNAWLWRITWHEGRAYGIDYRGTSEYFGHPYSTRLLVSDDGLSYDVLADDLLPGRNGSESTLRFLADGRAVCVSRTHIDGGAIGIADAPYTNWQWRSALAEDVLANDSDADNLRFHNLGGPDLIVLPDNRIVVAGRRSNEGDVGTALYWLEPDTLTLEEFAVLRGDQIIPRDDSWHCSYPGLEWHDEALWVSFYYPDRSGKKAIYLARLTLPN